MRQALLATLTALIPAALQAAGEDVTEGPLLLPVEVAASRTDDRIAEAELLPDPVVFAPVPTVMVAVAPLAAGLPEPSILVGMIEGVTRVDPVPEPEATETPAIAWDDVAVRRAVRDDNPELFASLLDSGAFDPPEDLLKTALQTELQRMRCYEKAIDGAWGGGSIEGVKRYYNRISETAPTLEADVRLFRQFVRVEVDDCPPLAVPTSVPRVKTVAPAKSSPKAATRKTNRPNTTQTAQTKKRTVAPTPKAPAAKPVETKPVLRSLIGVTR